MTFRTLHQEHDVRIAASFIFVGLQDVPDADTTWTTIWGDMGDA